MNELIQGGFEATGIRDAADFISCGADTVTFLPLWVDDSHTPSAMANKEQKFILNRQFKAGSPVPLAQYQMPDSMDWFTASVKFQYGEGNKPENLDDIIKVTDPIQDRTKIKFTFTPDPAYQSNVQKSFVYNQSDKHIYKTYKDQMQDMLRTMPGVKVERLHFIYYDNLNQEILPASEGNYLSKEQIKQTTAVKIYLLLSKKDDWREATSYVNVRNIASVGMSIIEGSIVPLPSSTRMKAFSIGNFYGRKKEGIIRLLIKPADYRDIAIQLKIVPDASGPERMKVEKFQIESPPGKVLASSFINQTFTAAEFVNLMALDRTGFYDYDDDEGVDDFYLATQEPVFLEVERLDFAGASLFLKP
jgi:hypothetical protein